MSETPKETDPKLGRLLPRTESGPTPPFDGLLDPDIQIKIGEQKIAATCPLLREVINYSTHAFAVAEEGAAAQLALDEAWAPLRLYYQVLEMADGVELLLRQAASYQAIVLLRSAVEAGLYHTLIHKHADFRKASLAWLVGAVQRDIEEGKRKLPAPDLGRKVIVADDNDVRPTVELNKEIAGLTQQLKQPHLQPMAQEIKNGAWLDYLLGKPRASLWTCVTTSTG